MQHGAFGQRMATRQEHRRSLRLSAAGVGSFLFHLAEMWVAMLLGMMLFVPARLTLTARGFAAAVGARLSR